MPDGRACICTCVAGVAFPAGSSSRLRSSWVWSQVVGTGGEYPGGSSKVSRLKPTVVSPAVGRKVYGGASVRFLSARCSEDVDGKNDGNSSAAVITLAALMRSGWRGSGILFV